MEEKTTNLSQVTDKLYVWNKGLRIFILYFTVHFVHVYYYFTVHFVHVYYYFTLHFVHVYYYFTLHFVHVYYYFTVHFVHVYYYLLFFHFYRFMFHKIYSDTRVPYVSKYVRTWASTVLTSHHHQCRRFYQRTENHHNVLLLLNASSITYLFTKKYCQCKIIWFSGVRLLYWSTILY